MKRALVIVLDSVGCGRAPDAAAYGDTGADHTREQVPLMALGLESPLENGVFSDVARIVEGWFR